MNTFLSTLQIHAGFLVLGNFAGERGGKRRVGCSGILNTMRERVEDSPHRPDATSDEEVGWGGPYETGQRALPAHSGRLQLFVSFLLSPSRV